MGVEKKLETRLVELHNFSHVTCNLGVLQNLCLPQTSRAGAAHLNRVLLIEVRSTKLENMTLKFFIEKI